MKRLLKLAVAVAAVATSLSVHASVIDAKFSGTVASQVNTSFAVGTPISGEFFYDTFAGRYLSFMVGGQSVAPGYSSSASITPDQYSAIYQAQLSPVLGGAVNSTFAVDLEGLSPWPFRDPMALLLDAGQLAANLDTSLSNFGFYTANADGTGVRSLNAMLTGIRVSAVPEPGTAVLLLVGVAAVGSLRRSRRSRR